MEDSARAYNAVAEDLKVAPYTAKYARGRNLSMNVDVKAKKRDGLLKTDVRRDILPALQELRTEFVAHSASLRNHCLLEKDALEDLAAAIGELEELDAGQRVGTVTACDGVGNRAVAGIADAAAGYIHAIIAAAAAVATGTGDRDIAAVAGD